VPRVRRNRSKTAPAIATKGCLVVGGRSKQPFPEMNRGKEGRKTSSKAELSEYVARIRGKHRHRLANSTAQF
jgi:hypothetical protein